MVGSMAGRLAGSNASAKSHSLVGSIDVTTYKSVPRGESISVLSPGKNCVSPISSWKSSPGPGSPSAAEQGIVVKVAGSKHSKAVDGRKERLKAFWTVNWTVLPLSEVQLTCP